MLMPGQSRHGLAAFGLASLAMAMSGAAAAGTPGPAGLDVRAVTQDVYAIVGEMGQRSPQNLGDNATFGALVTDSGVVLVDSGGSRAGAAAIDAALRTVTDKPVVVVINTGGQDHRWLGNGYFKAKGARLVASAAAVADQRERASMQFTILDTLVGRQAMAGTEPVYADETFQDATVLTVGGRRIEIVHPSPAHTPGDSFVWLPDERVVFTGDIVFTERLLGVLDYSNSAGWVTAFEAMAAKQPRYVIPGHGRPTTLATATADTYDYLVNLRTRMRAYMDAGGDAIGAVGVDQSAFAHLRQFDALARRNAQRVFMEMEWE